MPRNEKKEEMMPLIDSSWKSEWKDMPEFIQDCVEPFQTIIMRFRSQEDVNAFSKLLDQTITPNTKSLWYPKLVQKSRKERRYADGS
jgi:hypothetical protein